MKERIEIPVFTWFLIGALLFSVFTFLLGIWVCANAPRDDRGMDGPVPMINESDTSLSLNEESMESANAEMTIPDPMADMDTREPEPEPERTEPAKPEQQKSARAQVAAKPEQTKPTNVQTTGNRVYYIQLTATPDNTAARKMKQQFEKKGYNVYLMDVTQQGKKLYKVRIGVFSTRKQAAAVAEKIRKEDKIKPWIVAM